MKLVAIGIGSVIFGIELLRDVFRVPEFRGGELWLVDTHAAALARMTGLADRLNAAADWQMTIHATEDRLEALSGGRLRGDLGGRRPDRDLADRPRARPQPRLCQRPVRERRTGRAVAHPSLGPAHARDRPRRRTPGAGRGAVQLHEPGEPGVPGPPPPHLDADRRVVPQPGRGDRRRAPERPGPAARHDRGDRRRRQPLHLVRVRPRRGRRQRPHARVQATDPRRRSAPGAGPQPAHRAAGQPPGDRRRPRRRIPAMGRGADRHRRATTSSATTGGAWRTSTCSRPGALARRPVDRAPRRAVAGGQGRPQRGRDHGRPGRPPDPAPSVVHPAQ